MEKIRKIRPELIGVAEESRKNKDYHRAFNLATQGLGIDIYGGLREDEINKIDLGYLFPLIRISFDSWRGKVMRIPEARKCLGFINDGLDQVIEAGYSQSAKLAAEKFSRGILFNMRRDVSRFGELAGMIIFRKDRKILASQGLMALERAAEEGKDDPVSRGIIAIEKVKITARYNLGEIDPTALEYYYDMVLGLGNNDEKQAVTYWLGEIAVRTGNGGLLNKVIKKSEGRTNWKKIASRVVKERGRELVLMTTAARLPAEKRNELSGRLKKIAQVWEN